MYMLQQSISYCWLWIRHSVQVFFFIRGGRAVCSLFDLHTSTASTEA